MADVSRRRVLSSGLGAGAAALLAGCEVPKAGRGTGPSGGAAETPAAEATTNPDNDGSWRDTGPQPHQPQPKALEPGETPPQFVVISWDGAGESPRLPLLSHFRGVAKELNASMTLFLSGLYFLPKEQRTRYHPPGRAPGASAIPFLGDDAVHATIDNIGQAWSEGHEIGTHFNGHFCGAGGVGTWTPDQWKVEVDQAVKFVMTWRTATGFTDLPPTPFDYRKELVGGRTPCLEGSANLRTTAGGLGWRYDTSSTGTQVWPSKAGPLWALDLQSIPFSGGKGSVLSMDYNLMYNQSTTPNGDPAKRPGWQRDATNTYLAGFTRAYEGNRAPLIIGNHFEDWNGGIYMQAVEDAMWTMATYPDTRFVSFRQLCDYLDAQPPTTLATLQKLPIGTAPSKGWAAYLTPEG
ncbi:MAG TPA: hypothetical protein VFR40_14850 [Lapillicoccus sp.]|nr:hypothetical protein [Lapillicoccus sp.]